MKKKKIADIVGKCIIIISCLVILTLMIGLIPELGRKTYFSR